MRALLPLLLAGCLPLDGLVLGGERLDAYDLPLDRVPEEALEWVTFHSLDGTVLQGLWVRHHDLPNAPVVVAFHGNGGPIGYEWGRVETHWSWGYDVFTFDYRGYGRSEGEVDRDGIFEQDGLAAVQYVAESGVPVEEQHWIALSLGGAVAIHTADEVRPRALVLESTFASTDQLADEGSSLDLPPGWFFEADYDNVAAIRHILPPVFIIHGLADDFVAPTHGRSLYRAAPDNPKWLWQPEGVDHSDIHRVMPEAYRARVTAFLANPEQDPAAADGGVD